MEGSSLKIKATGGHFDPEASTLRKPSLLPLTLLSSTNSINSAGNPTSQAAFTLHYPPAGAKSSLPAGSHLGYLPTDLTLAPSLSVSSIFNLSHFNLFCHSNKNYSP